MDYVWTMCISVTVFLNCHTIHDRRKHNDNAIHGTIQSASKLTLRLLVARGFLREVLHPIDGVLKVLGQIAGIKGADRNSRGTELESATST